MPCVNLTYIILYAILSPKFGYNQNHTEQKAHSMPTKKTTAEIDIFRGLAHLMQPGKGNKWTWRHLDVCHERIDRRSKHPFGLAMSPVSPGIRSRNVTFVTTEASEECVQIFLAAVRYYVGFQEEEHVTRLRVISMPISKGQRGQDDVFFELETENDTIISGLTTNYSGGGNVARLELEHVFALLAMLFNITIERVNVRTVPVRTLFAEEQMA